jgi:hypothetical protein
LQWTAVTWLLASTVVGFASAAVMFEVQEWLRRRRHSRKLRAALRGELERLDHVLTSVVYLRGPGEPTATHVKEARRFLAAEQWSTKTLGDPPPDDALAQALQLATRQGYTQSQTLTAPVLAAVLAAPPQGWDAELLRQLSWLAWQIHQLNDTAEDMRYWLRATTTVPAEHAAVAHENHAKCVRGHHEQAGTVLEAVRAALACIKS